MNNNTQLERYRKRTKKNNDRVLEDSDRLSIVVPKGTKDKIKNKYPDISINKYINMLIEQDLEKSDLHNVSEYRSECVESPTIKNNSIGGKNIDNENKIDSVANNERRKSYKDMTQEEINAMLADIPLTGKVKTYDYGLQNIQNDIDAKSAIINKPVEQEPTLTGLAQEIEQRKESAKQQEEQPPF